jgi:sugar-specific transcriptional regulator TrmB
MVNNQLVSILTKFGLDSSESYVYLTLLQHSVQTPLQLSRLTNINRTTLYRILERLVSLGLVQEILGHKTTSFQASDPKNIQILLTKKRLELDRLTQDFSQILPQLSSLQNTSLSPTKVLYFHGRNGLKQLLWNTLSATTEVIGYGYGNWNDGIGKDFAEKIRQGYVDHHIFTRELQNNEQRLVDKDYTSVLPYLETYYSCRYLPQNKIDIHHDTYIYNHTFSFYHIYQGEFFGVEIHNAQIAKTQRQIFDILWSTAQP